MWRVLARIENVLAIAALVLFSVFIVTSVFFRYVLDLPLSWPEEASLIAFSWLLFLGGAICARDDAHILIDIFAPDPASWVGRASDAFAALVGALVSAVMTYIGFRYAVGAAPMVTPIFRISSAVYNAAAPVGFALITLHFLRHAAIAMRPPSSGERERQDI
ncbi:TRAP transporter small permease subunit [Aurantimonas sp. C2-6-R+9]|uniref:TRAP transporter small permease n=1 Tax=unclassified Aurantimonas TaxID=2638230 RepID=UPI002E18AAA0|nr:MULTISPECIES: TRAP transporter small permease subunit [unclassified Aurantimonas]MEC5293248.1 TRAP transporter small permease subunit [Aurantimonas sp. C2-3-R2]MEC5383388.1 TRAP transporter small permease subunit [Aurantimonas sp. C2-6-R+9]MEC5414342.1 TRAP transporter small permease subunit [Aurantimonas sp. C2-4-R8]